MKVRPLLLLSLLLASSFLVFEVAVPPARASGCYGTPIAITLTNSQSSATANPYEQMITFDPAVLSSLEASDLGNLRFYSDSSCSIGLFSWIESCSPSCSPSATSATVWVKVPIAIGAGSSAKIYADFLSTATDFDKYFAGEAPQLSGTYAEYDNGAKVFPVYEDWAGSSDPSGWTSSVASACSTGHTETVATSNGLTLTAGADPCQFYSYNTAQNPGVVIEDYGETTAASNAANGGEFGVLASTSQTNFLSYYYLRMAYVSSAQTWQYDFDAGTAVNTGTPTLNTFYLVGIYLGSGGAAVYLGYSQVASSSSASPSGEYVGIGIDANAVVKADWFRVRTAPPGGVMPTASGFTPSYVGGAYVYSGLNPPGCVGAAATCTLTFTTTAGDLVIVAAALGLVSPGVCPSSVSLSATYLPAALVGSTGCSWQSSLGLGGGVSVWSGIATTSGSDTFTVTQAGTAATIMVFVEEFKGADGTVSTFATSTFDVSGCTGSGPYSCALSLTSRTFTGGAVVVGFYDKNVALSSWGLFAGTGFTGDGNSGGSGSLALFEHAFSDLSPNPTDFPATGTLGWNNQQIEGIGIVFGGSPAVNLLKIDGANFCMSTSAVSLTCSITTTSTDDIVFADLAVHVGTGTIHVQDSAGLTWTKRASAAPAGGTTNATEFYAKSPNVLAQDLVTVSWGGTSPEPGALLLYGVSGSNYVSPFDANAPWTSTGTDSAPSVSGISTSSSDTVITAFAAVDYGQPYPTGPPAECLSSGSYTLQLSPFQVAVSGAMEYETFTQPQSGESAYFSDCDTSNWGMIADALVSASSSANAFTCSITNMDAGNYVIPSGKRYSFQCAVSNAAVGGSGPVTSVAVQFYDTPANLVEFAMQNSSGAVTYSVLSGGSTIQLGTGTATTATSNGVETLTVTLPVSFQSSVLDADGIDLYLRASTANASRGFEIVQPSYFNILNKGGGTTKIFRGNATGGSGGCTYCVDVGYHGSAAVNSTWYGLQQYDTQFAITLSDNNFTHGTPTSLPGDPYLWQDYANWFSSDPTYTVPGTWSVAIHWYYWDGSQWVDGEHVVVSMQRGNQGTADEWVTLGMEWYKGSTLVSKSQNVTAWIENGATSAGGANTAVAQVRIFVDLWFSNQNASETMGGHVNAYFFGMHSTGYFWWTSWSPTFENSSISQVLVPSLDHSGTTVSSAGLLFSKIGYNVTRTHSAYGSASETSCSSGVSNSCEFYTVSLHNFDIEHYVTTTPSDMGGVNAPAFTAPQVPDLPQGGFFTPLYALLAGLAAQIWGVIAGALAAIWASFGANFPWFTAFWGDVYAGIVSFSSLLFAIFGWLVGLLGFLVPLVSLVTTPIAIIGSAWNTISGLFTEIFKGVDIGQVAELYVVIVFGSAVMGAAMAGDMGFFVRLARQTWAIVHAILFWTYWLAKAVIDAIVGVIP